ncbi:MULTISPECIES: AAA family ATPase [unclassified Francisella]|uniref:AAA family ATPase n=1 Tax=unclassified Francisella TaxID=2610885 RepID=UPI002E376F6F|nr:MULTISPECIES: AAA family ATPase [unclassified Francisella]MED7818314.1 AAA family ATPase [Francisella sp. 19S2-4]MED7829150.1 AAA family ATPase [Francisella sp. 19S2-10]
MSNIEYTTIEDNENILKQEPLRALDWADIVNMDLKEKSYMLEPLIREKDLVMIYAPAGVGKTHVSTGIAWAVSTGSDFLGWKATKSKKVLIIDGEMPLRSIRDRLQKLPECNNNRNLKIISSDTLEDNQIMPDISLVEGQQAIKHLTDWADFIILDNLSSLCRTGQENTTEAWKLTQSWLLELRAKNKTVLIVDHAGKNGANRGASAKQDVLDTVLSLKRPNDYENEQGARFIIKIGKNRNANPIEEIEAHLVNGVWNVSNAKQSIIEEVINLHEGKLTQRDIASEVGISVGKVNKIIQAHNKQKDYLKK